MLKNIIPIAAFATASIAFPALAADTDDIAQSLVGSWKTTEAVGIEGAEGVVTMHIAPIFVNGLDNAFYAELAREDDEANPYRQVVFSLYEFDGRPRLRTYEFRNTPGAQPTLVGLWAVPEIFPSLHADALIATLDVEFQRDGDTWSGATPYPYPTGVGGAVQMTSAITLSEGSIVIEDRGYSADGSIAWGPDTTGAYSFQPYEPDIHVELFDQGLVLVDFEKPAGHEATDGDSVTVHYTGWVRDQESQLGNGWEFDSSYDRPNGPQPYTFALPGRVIQGWNLGMKGATVGTLRRLYIPSSLAYGSQAAAGGKIPPNSDVFFEVEVLDIISPDTPAGNAPADQTAEPVPHDHDGDGIPDHD